MNYKKLKKKLNTAFNNNSFIAVIDEYIKVGM